jgi:hypothetical protein
MFLVAGSLAAWATRSLLLAAVVCACGHDPEHARRGAATADVETPAARAEPITVSLEGWRASAESSTATHRHVELTSPSGSCATTLDRWWGLPPDTGGVSHEDSSRRVIVDGVPLSIAELSIFEGSAQKVDALFVHDDHDFARLAFRGCEAAEVDAVLAKARLSASVKASPRR